MSQGDVLTVMREGILVMLKMSAPLLIVSIIVGLIIAIFQAATQIHEQTLTFVPKLLVIMILLLVLGSWMLTLIGDFITLIFSMMTQM